MKNQTVVSDITVIGGGLAGVCAAISAARLGKRVALVGNRPVLGGNSSSEVRVWVVGATAHGMQRFARESGVIGELYVENQYRNPEGNPIHWDEVVMDAVRAEPGIQLFLNTDVRTVQTWQADGETVIRSVVGWTMGSEIETTFESPYFIDATGDGLVGALAGADFMLGREAKAEFGEDWAPDVADLEFLGSTILFYTKDTGKPIRYIAPDSAKDISTTPIPHSRIIRSGDSGAHYWWIEWGGELDIVHENETIRDELRSVIFGIWDYIKNSGEFESETLDLEWVGTMPGKREYRRFIGDHVLTQNDILDQVEFEDAAAFGGWSIDLHPVEGMYGTVAGAHQRYSNGIYGIPFRSYYSRSVPNMLMAGRDISATHVAFGSSRVMATCAAGGEAAGTGAALAHDLGVYPRAISAEHAADLRQLLLKQDASVFGVRNEDSRDLARSAKVSASSTLRTLEPAPRENEATRSHPLGEDLGVLIPVDPRLDSVSVLLTARADTTLDVSLWTTGKKQNAVPVDEQSRVSMSISASADTQRITVPLSWAPSTPENVVVIFGANPDVSIELTHSHAPGVLALTHHPEDDGDANVAVSHDEPLVQWPAHILRGWGARLGVEPQTAAYDATKAIGGYQRPYGGPQLWVSERVDAGRDEWLELEWDTPQLIGEFRLVFDDDVDVELNTLHHHRSPHLVFPQLVRDYTIEGHVDGAWVSLVTATDNRRRQRVHKLSAQAPVSAVRVRIHATNGDAHARIISVRVYA